MLVDDLKPTLDLDVKVVDVLIIDMHFLCKN